MTDKLTTAKKAEDYVSGYRHSRLTVAKEGIEIITALLKEREALLDVVKYFNEHGDCLGSALKIKEAIALCEENQDDQ